MRFSQYEPEKPELQTQRAEHDWLKPNLKYFI